MGKLMFVGLLLILIGILIVIIAGVSLALQSAQGGKSKANIAVGGFIGPIPFGFFTSKKMFWVWLLMLVVGITLWILARKIL